MVNVINQADSTVAGAIQAVLPAIAQVVDAVAECLKQGGRLFYIGAGTSGRLAVMVQNVHPFGTSPEMVQSIAGGQDAMLKAVENIEDSAESAIAELKNANFVPKMSWWALLRVDVHHLP